MFSEQVKAFGSTLSDEDKRYILYATAVLGGALAYTALRRPETMGEILNGVGKIIDGIIPDGAVVI